MTALHPHGHVNRYRHGNCHCDRCKAAHAAAARQRRRDKAYGRYRGDVDAEQVRLHVQELRAAGVSVPIIAELAGVNVWVVEVLLYGRPSRNQPPTRKMRAVNADKLMAVRAEMWFGVAS